MLGTAAIRTIVPIADGCLWQHGLAVDHAVALAFVSVQGVDVACMRLVAVVMAATLGLVAPVATVDLAVAQDARSAPAPARDDTSISDAAPSRPTPSAPDAVPVFDADIVAAHYPNVTYVANGVAPVAEATLVSPVDGAVSVGTVPTLVAGASGMSSPEAIQYQYEVCAGTGACNTPIVTSGWVSGSWKVPAGKLAANTTYSWTVSVRNNPYMGTLFNPTHVFATGASRKAYGANDYDVVQAAPAVQALLESRTPILKAGVIHSAGQTFQYDFKVSLCASSECTSTTLVADSGWVRSASWQVPSTALGWGGTYKWSVSINTVGGLMGSLFPPSRTFAVAVPASAAVRVGIGSSTDLVEGVSLYDRHFEYSATDASVIALGTPLNVTRAYSSTAAADGPFGVGWWSVLSVALKSTALGYTVVMADGHEFVFAKNPNGTYAPGPGAGTASLVACASGCVAAFTDSSGTRYEFTSAGLSKVTSGDGLVTNITRSNAGVITKLTDASSKRSLSLTWAGNHVASVTQDGAPADVPATWTYQYTGAQLSAVCSPGSAREACTRYGYTTATSALLSSVTLPGRSSSPIVTYGANSVASVTSDQVTTSFSAVVGATGQSVTVTSSTGASSAYQLDADGRTIGLTARGGSQRWQYDYAGRLTLYRSAAGDTMRLAYFPSGALKSRYVWREDGNEVPQAYDYVPSGKAAGKLWMVSALGNAPSWTGSAADSDALALSKISYDSAGRVSAVRSGVPTFDFANWTSVPPPSETYAYTTGSETAVGGGVVPAGLLQRVTDTSGMVTVFEYDSIGNLRRETPGTAASIEYAYDWAGRATSVTRVGDGQRRTEEVAYDALGRESARTFPETTDAVTGDSHRLRSSWTYDLGGSVTSSAQVDLVSGETRQVAYSYDAYGRLLSQTEPDGVISTRRTYDAAGRLLTASDGDGGVVRYEYSPYGDVVATIAVGTSTSSEVGEHDLTLERLTYDASGRVASRTDQAGLVRDYTYAFDDNIATVIARGVPGADGGTQDRVELDAVYDKAGLLSYLARDNKSSETSLRYDSLGRPTMIQAAIASVDGVPRTFRVLRREYDVRGNVILQNDGVEGPLRRFTRYTYDAQGRMTSRAIAPPDGAAPVSVDRYAYNAFGEVTGHVDPRVGATDAESWTTQYEYDALGRVVSTSIPSGTATPAVTRSGFDAFGEVTSTTGPDGQLTTTSFDVRGRAVTTTLAHEPSDPDPAEVVTTYTPGGRTASVTDALGARTSHTYDTLGNLTATVLPPLDPTQPERTWTYSWDDAGDNISQRDPLGNTTTDAYDVLGQRISSTDATGATTHYGYDEAGHLTSEQSPSGAVTTASYNALGELVRVMDPDGVGATIYRDLLGHPVKIVSTDGTTRLVNYDLLDNPVAMSVVAADGTSAQNWAWANDPAGNQVRETDPLGNVRSFEFDPQDHLTAMVEPDGARTTLTYGLSGTATSITDPLGRTTTASYDAAGHRTSVTEPPASDGEPVDSRTWTWEYDAAGRAVLAATPDGRLVSATLDADSNVTSQVARNESSTQTRTFTYDALDRLTAFDSAAGGQSLAYDPAGRLSSSDGVSGASALVYDVDGRLVSRSDAAGTALFAWTAGGRLAEAQLPGAGPQSFTYDTAGRVATQSFAGGSRVRAYGAQGEITDDTTTDAQGAEVVSWHYGYDAAGHRTSRSRSTAGGQTTTTYSYDQNGRLTSWIDQAPHTVTWDAASQATSIDGVSRTVDGRGRLVDQGGQRLEYSDDGRLLGTGVEPLDYDLFGDLTTDGAGSALSYDALGRLVRIDDDQVSYAGTQRSPSSIGAELIQSAPDGTPLTSDGAVTLLDPHGDVAATFADGQLVTADYTPFGVPTDPDGGVGFQHDLTLENSGLVDMQARWYSPALASFLDRDDSRLPVDQQNRYGYANGDPINYSDPSGRCAIPEPHLALACEGAVVGGEIGTAIEPGVGTAVGGVTLGAAVLVGSIFASKQIANFLSALNGSGARTNTSVWSNAAPFDLSFTVDLDLPDQGWAGSVNAPSIHVSPVRIDPIRISPIHIAPVNIGSISIPEIHIDPVVIDLPWTNTSTAPTAWVSGAMPIGLSTTTAAAACGQGGSSACRAASAQAGPVCASAGAPIASACSPSVTGVWANEPAAVNGSSVAAAAGTAATHTPGVQSDCEPGQLPTQQGCEEPLDFLQRKVNETRDRLSSNRSEYESQLSRAERDAAERKPWVEPMNHGKAVERSIWQDPEVQEFFTQGGGPGKADLFGASDGLGWEITTSNPGTVAAHLRRAYVVIERLVTYVQW